MEEIFKKFQDDIKAKGKTVEYTELLKAVEHELEKLNPPADEQPYIRQGMEVRINWEYNPKYGDDRECECGHPYYRHFDTYEGMYPCGCKYCGCGEFKEKK